MEKDEGYERARKKVEARVGFYIHLAVYIGVNVLLVIINVLTSPEYLWFRWPLLGWGIGVFFHGMSVFVFSGRRLREMKERMIEEEMRKGPR